MSKYIGDTEKEIELKSRQAPESLPVTLILYKDGALGFSTDHAEHFIYLYKDQVRKLKRILKNKLLGVEEPERKEGLSVKEVAQK